MNDRLRQHRSHPYFPNRFQLGQRDHNPFDLFKPIAKRSAGLLKRNGAGCHNSKVRRIWSDERRVFLQDKDWRFRTDEDVVFPFADFPRVQGLRETRREIAGPLLLDTARTGHFWQTSRVVASFSR